MAQVPPRSSLRFADLFDLEEVQAVQDAFAHAAGVASIIVDPDGTPLTRPSNFTHLCLDLIRSTAAGLALCMHSDRVIGRAATDGPNIRPCLSCGLWNGGARISIGQHHLASWLVGQVRDAHPDEARARAHARELGIDEDSFVTALLEVPVMNHEKFAQVCQSLHLMASLLSRQASRNIELQRVVAAKERAEAERDRLEDHMRQAAKLEALGRLAGGVAHDFNNLLTAIQGYAEMLRDDVAPLPEAQETLAQLMQVSGRAAGVVRGLLDFSRKEKQHSEPVALGAVAREVARMLGHGLDPRIAVTLDLDPDDPVVIGDSTQIQNAILNLAINARDAMVGGGHLSITTRQRELGADQVRLHPHMPGAGRYCEIRVTDDGTGMSPATRERIFEPFFTTKPAGVGTGLGLSAVYGCVKSHRGGVDVQSEPGSGTEVTVLLPLAENAVVPADSVRTTRAARAPATAARVLIVDDEEPVRLLLEKIFQRAGYEVTIGRNGAEAVDLFVRADGRFDLVVLDLVMPEKMGDEVLELLRAREPAVRVLAISGGTDGDPAARMFAAGARAFIAKPFRPSDLLHLAAQVITAADGRAVASREAAG